MLVEQAAEPSRSRAREGAANRSGHPRPSRSLRGVARGWRMESPAVSTRVEHRVPNPLIGYESRCAPTYAHPG